MLRKQAEVREKLRKAVTGLFITLFNQLQIPFDYEYNIRIEEIVDLIMELVIGGQDERNS